MPKSRLMVILALAVSLGASACQAFVVAPPPAAAPAAARVTVAPTPEVLPTATTPPTPTSAPAEEETPPNRLDLTDDSVQYWSNPNSIHDLIHDGATLWAATFGGLVGWVNSKYTIYGMQQGLPSQAVQALAVDNQGRLWMSYADIDGYSVRTGGTWTHYATRREAVSSEYASLLGARRTHPRMWVNRNGSGWIWQPRLDGRVEAYDGARWRIYGTDNGLTQGNRFVGVSATGRVWAVGDGIAYADEGELWWQDHTFFSEIETPDDVTDIAVDSDGTLWITFAGEERGGLIRFDPAGQRWEGHLNEINPAIPPLAHRLRLDGDGTLWVAGSGSISYHIPQRRFSTFDLGAVTALSFAEDLEGRLWIGSQNGLWALDTDSGEMNGPFEVPSPLPDNRINGLALDGQGTLFVATGRGVSWINDSGMTELTTDRAVSWLGTDSAGQVWGATELGLSRINRDSLSEPTFAQQDVLAAELADPRRAYILTVDGKLLAHDGTSAVELSDIMTLTGALPRDVAADPQGGLWVATASGLVYLAADGAQTIYTHENGLLSDDVRGVAVDPEGSVWVATANGLARHRSDGRWTRFTVESSGGGLRDMDLRDLSVGPSGDLWIATRAGLSRREPTAADWAYLDLPGARRVVHDGKDHLWVSTGAGLYRVPIAALVPAQG